MEEHSWFILKQLTAHPLEDGAFRFHTHSGRLEILVFLRGDAQFRVEGSVYPLRPYDTVIAAPNEMHRVFHLSDTPYERVVMNIETSFFAAGGCGEYAVPFLDRTPGEGNLIPAEITAGTGFRECLERLISYQNAGENEVLVKSVLIELLYLLHKSALRTEKADGSQEAFPPQGSQRIREVISYINEHLTENVTPDSLSRVFFINKSYLCRAFKRHTGYTVNHYIAHKRILMVRELCAGNESLTQASLEAGFGNYSSFYRMYVKETGRTPKEDLKS